MRPSATELSQVARRYEAGRLSPEFMREYLDGFEKRLKQAETTRHIIGNVMVDYFRGKIRDRYCQACDPED